MRRILGGMVLLLILVAVSGGCQDRRKDEIPTQQLDPKELPPPVHVPSPD